MKTGTAFTWIIVIGLMLGYNTLNAQKAEELLPQAIQLEEVKGELEEAIKTYQSIIDRYPENGKACAEALLRMGNCYEKLGREEAIKSYQLILDKYSGQTEQAAVARARLAKLIKPEPGEFIAEKMNYNIMDPFGISPDGNKAVGVRYIKGQNIVVSYLNTDRVDYITNFEWGNEYYYTYNPVWSPDSREVAYLTGYAGTNLEEAFSLRVSDLTGESRTLLSSSHEYFSPNDWSKDGSSILTFKGDTSGNLQLGLVPAEGGDFRSLVTLHGMVQTAGQSRAEAKFSPDGKYIVYTDIMPGTEGDIYVIGADGKSTWPLNSNPASEKWPRWSPDGKHIIFLSNRLGSWALWGIAVENGKPAGDPFLIREGMGSNLFGSWTVHGLVSLNIVDMRDIFLLDVNSETGEPKGKPEQLSYLPSGSNTHLMFAPDGNRLAFIRKDQEAEKAYLVVTGPDEEVEVEAEIPDGYNSINNIPRSIRWKPDGKSVGVICGNSIGHFAIKTYNLDSQKWETIQLLYPLRSFDFTGDGKRFYMSLSGMYEYDAGIFVYDPETGEKEYIYRPETRNIVTFDGIRCNNDYSKMAFLESSFTDINNSTTQQVIIDLNTKESHTAGINRFASWSPDGEKIMSFAGGSPSLMVYSSAGDLLGQYSLSEEMPAETRIRHFDWSVDGLKVAFVSMYNISDYLLYRNIIQ